MISERVLGYWIACSGIREMAKGLNASQIGNYVQFLSQIQDANQLREQLANINNEAFNEAFRQNPPFKNADAFLKQISDDTKNKQNLDAVVYLLSGYLDQMDSEDPAYLATVLEWALLISEYTGLHSSGDKLKAHAYFLQGVALHKEGVYDKAIDAYWACEERYASKADASILVSICQFSQGRLQMDFAKPESAAPLYAKARQTVAGMGADANAWLEIMQSDQAHTSQQSAFLDQLLACGATDQQDRLIESRLDLVDEDLATFARNRNIRMVVEGLYDEAVRASRLTNTLAARFGSQEDFRKQMVAFYNEQRDFARADALLKLMLQENPDDEENLIEVAKGYLQQGRDQEGIDLLRQIVSKNPRNADALAILGGYFAGYQQYFAANYYLERALAVDPNNAGAKTFIRAVPPPEVYLDPETRELTISQEIMGKKSPEEMADLMMAAMVTSLPDQADELLKVIAQDKGEEAAERVRGIAFGIVGGSSMAGAEMSHFDLAEQYFAMRKLPEAIQEYELAIGEDPSNAQAYMGLGDAYYMQGKYETALSYFEESISVQPMASTYRFIGDTYQHLGSADKAIDAYENALKLDPNYSTALQALEELRKRKGA